MQSKPIPTENTFISKYKPYYISDVYYNQQFQFVLKTLFEINSLNVLFVGNPSSGKTTLLYSIIRQYYDLSKDTSFPENNILHINNLKEQGINYFRNEMKSFCKSRSTIFGKKKLLVIDDLDMINEQSQQVPELLTNYTIIIVVLIIIIILVIIPGNPTLMPSKSPVPLDPQKVSPNEQTAGN